MKLLLAHGARLKALDAGGNTPLHTAAAVGAALATRALLDAGGSDAAAAGDGATAAADVSPVEGVGSPLHRALLSPHANVAAQLLEWSFGPSTDLDDIYAEAVEDWLTDMINFNATRRAKMAAAAAAVAAAAARGATEAALPGGFSLYQARSRPTSAPARHDITATIGPRHRRDLA